MKRFVSQSRSLLGGLSLIGIAVMLFIGGLTFTGLFLILGHWALGFVFWNFLLRFPVSNDPATNLFIYLLAWFASFFVIIGVALLAQN